MSDYLVRTNKILRTRLTKTRKLLAEAVARETKAIFDYEKAAIYVKQAKQDLDDARLATARYRKELEMRQKRDAETIARITLEHPETVADFVERAMVALDGLRHQKTAATDEGDDA